MVGAGRFNGNRCCRFHYRLLGMLWRHQGKLMHGTYGKIDIFHFVYTKKATFDVHTPKKKTIIVKTYVIFRTRLVLIVADRDYFV